MAHTNKKRRVNHSLEEGLRMDFPAVDIAVVG